ncbi:hypothetical protein IKF57_00525 [Candidatus Saccharibacteria bacterium]|nr:hypothetical protein [Candidatus Saccharibacteria bacterium]
MDTATWILVVILSITLLVFLIAGIVLVVRLIGLSKEVEKVVIEGQDIAKNTNGIVANVKGMTAFGGTVQMFVDKYINPKLKDKMKEITKEEHGGKSGKK